MANSMNNWLGFSLSPQEQLPSQHDSQSSASRLGGFTSDDISGTGADCYSAPSFGILEAFHRNHNHHQSHHDWNMKGLGLSSDMFMGGSCNGQSLESQEPKLENFLGGHSFADSKIYDGEQYNMYSSSSLQQLPSSEDHQSRSDGGNIGLSMIKTWLRNQPTPQPEAKADGALTTTQTLSLSMSTGGAAAESSSTSDTNKQNKSSAGGAAVDSQAAAGGAAAEAAPRKSIDTFGQRTSIYRGVTRHRWTGRYEAHLWDNSCRREGQTRKGRQVYLGGYDKEDKAARAYDLAALKYWGATTTTNFPISTYEKELEEMKHMTRQEYVASLRRKSSGFSRGASIYRGVTRHHQHGRWQARIGRVAGNKDLYLGTFSTQEEAAEAYDIAAIKFRGLNAVTNFDMSRYDVKSILDSTTLPIGAAAKRLKDAADHLRPLPNTDTTINHDNNNNIISTDYASSGWPTIAFQNPPPPPPPFSVNYYNHRPAGWCKQEQDSPFQDLHLSGSTHNFFHNNNNNNNNLMMTLDSPSAAMEHSSGSNSVIYADHYNNNNNNGYVIPMSTVIDSNCNSNNGFGDGGGGGEFVKPLGYNDAADPYSARNLYYLSQQSSNKAVAAAYHDQGSACNNWVPTAVPTLAPRTNNVALCHGAQTFAMWNDT